MGTVLICQRIYALALVKELGPDYNKTTVNNAYIPVHKTNS